MSIAVLTTANISGMLSSMTADRTPMAMFAGVDRPPACIASEARVR
ncbi:MAG: hypothetical protein H0U97_19260 [Gammaproteobacteria bacterium]|nr:hypothetical protein [Gammaproteobacteria bacterium]